MKQLKNLALLAIFVLLCGFGPLGGSGGSSGGGTTITSGAGDFGVSTSQSGAVLTGSVTKVNGNAPTTAAVTHQFATSSDSSARLTLAQPAFTDVSGTATAAQGGTGTAYGEPACTNIGPVASAGTATPNWANTNCNYFVLSSPSSSFTLANGTNLPTNAMVYIGFSQGAISFPTTTWGTQYQCYNYTDDKIEACSTSGHTTDWFTNNTTGMAWTQWWSDGTNLTWMGGQERATYNQVSARSMSSTLGYTIVSGGTIGITWAGDAVVTKAPRFAYGFSVSQQTALVANEHMGTYKTVQPITVENATVDEQSVTCAADATVTCYDCGTSAGACTSSQTATIWTSPAVTSALTGTSVAGGTITTANVAAGHYITCEVTAGTCATFQAAASLQYRMQ